MNSKIFAHTYCKDVCDYKCDIKWLLGGDNVRTFLSYPLEDQKVTSMRILKLRNMKTGRLVSNFPMDVTTPITSYHRLSLSLSFYKAGTHVVTPVLED